MFLTLLAAVPLVVLLYAFLVPNPTPIFGKYSRPGKWFWVKYCFMYAMLWVRRQQDARRKKVSGENAGWGKRSRSSPEEMDKAQSLSKDHPMAVDAVYFNGSNRDGVFLVAATARRHQGLVQTLLYVRLPGIGTFEIPSLPDTSLYTTKENAFSVSGLTLTPKEPMKTWQLEYEGPMRLIREDGNHKQIQMSFDLTWKATKPYFDFDTDMEPSLLSRTIAMEPWTREFFDDLKVAHQTHYEQFGDLTGTIHTDEFGDHEVRLQSMRDHSYGNIRDWGHLHRYAIQYINVEDGSAICIGRICMPLTLSRLPIGYVMRPDGTMDKLQDTNLELHRLGEDGNPPEDCEFNFVAGNQSYHVKCHVLDAPIFYMGENWEARLHERFCTFEVNGLKGWGISEWDYRNHTGKPEIYKTKSKPEKF